MSFSLYRQSLLLLLLAYSQLGWCPCEHCKQDDYLGYTCTNHECVYYLPESDEEEERLQEQRAKRRAEGKRRRENYEQLLQHAKQQAQPQPQPESACSSYLLEDLYRGLLRQHASLWDVMIFATLNLWRDSGITGFPGRSEIKKQAKLRLDALNPQSLPPEPEFEPPSQIQKLYNNQPNLEVGEDEITAIHTHLIMSGYQYTHTDFITSEEFEAQIIAALKLHPGALAIMTYQFIIEGSELALNYVFQMDQYGRVYCFTTEPGMLKRITLIPNLFYFVHTAIFQLNPEIDTVWLTVYYQEEAVFKLDNQPSIGSSENSDEESELNFANKPSFSLDGILKQIQDLFTLQGIIHLFKAFLGG